MTVKLCKKCKITKLISLFSKNIRKQDGFEIYCRSCRAIDSKIQYKKNKNIVAKRTKDRQSKLANAALIYVSNKKCSKCQIEKSINFFGYYKYSEDKHR